MMNSLAKSFCNCCVKRDEFEYQAPPQHIGGYTAAVASSSRQRQASARTSLGGLDTGPCIVCREAPATTMCQPCGHVLACFKCSLRYSTADGRGVHPDTRCPCCKQKVRSFQRVFTQSPASVAARAAEATRSSRSVVPSACCVENS
mmetsp:Transcript_102656/g.203793  ORF Transcript_102656/g.203793 Transcript_102656/m.203793 type:complete len:146 (-) Transcript_102656:90-527(-)